MNVIHALNTRAPIVIRAGKRLGDFWIVSILFGLVIFFWLASPPGTFLSLTNLKGLSIDTCEILLLAAGQTYVLIAAGIDLSVGSLVIFSAVLAVKILADFSGAETTGLSLLGPLALAIVASIAAGALWGAVNGWVTVKWRVPPFIVTLGTLWMALGLAQVISGGYNMVGVPTQIQNAWMGAGLFGVIPWPVAFTALCVGILWVILARSRFGLRTYALGANMEALRRAGVNVGRLTISIYVLMGGLCGVVGMMDVARFGTASLSAHTLDNLNAIAAVVIGGTSLFGGRGKMSGTVVGAFIPAVLRNGFIILAIQPFWQNFVIGAFLVFAVYIDQLRRGGVPVSWRRLRLRRPEDEFEAPAGEAARTVVGSWSISASPTQSDGRIRTRDNEAIKRKGGPEGTTQ